MDADSPTETWNVGVQIAVNKTNAQNMRMVWIDDIPYPQEEDTLPTWRETSWRELERRVFKLQKRIYKASRRGDVKAVRKLQKTLATSWSAKCLAVRRVTQDNQGKKTAGIDGVKSLTPQQRLELVKNLKFGTKAKSTRRVWIPKPGKEEKRPLGIPTMYDRALQALVKLALEPEWEARFESNSYGFRPGRNAQDAIKAIWDSLRYKSKYVLDADIAKCFDQINHEKLLEKVQTFPKFRRQLKAWLKSGVIDCGQYVDTSEGTPQGGVISPLLANIALHGLENHLMDYIKKVPLRYPGGNPMAARDKVNSLSVIRYADDFVVIHENLTIVQRCKEIISNWLSTIGLELKPSKTRIAHTLNIEGNEQPGFNFLGFNIRQHPIGKKHAWKNTQGKRIGHCTIITPSKESIRQHYRDIAEVVEKGKAWSQDKLIWKLNPKIRGWANYFSTANSSKTYSTLDHLIWCKLRAWAKHRHPKKSTKYWVKKYWQTVGNNHWCFSTPRTRDNPLMLIRHDSISCGTDKYVKVKGDKSPFDGDTIYWSQRLGKHPELSGITIKLLKLQSGKCPWCSDYFRHGDKWELDHKSARILGGKNTLSNLQLLHKHCHVEKTIKDKSQISSNKPSKDKRTRSK